MVPQKRRVNSRIHKAKNPVAKTAKRELYSMRKRACTSGKDAWRTELDAKIFLLTAKVHKPMRAYLCDECASWHITSQATAQNAVNVVGAKSAMVNRQNGMRQISEMYARTRL